MLNLMKKLNAKRHQWLLSHAQRQATRKLRWRQSKKARRRLLHAEYIAAKERPTRKTIRILEGRAELALPETLSLSDNYDETINFLESIRDAVLLRGRRVSIDFTTLHDIRPAAALLLAAELDRWRRLRQIRPRVLDIEKWDAEVRRLLNQMGLFKLLNVQNPPPATQSSDPAIHFIPFVSANQAIGPLAAELRSGFERMAGQIAGWKFLYEGIQEAMTNVMHHAYPRDTIIPRNQVLNQWWMAGSYDKRSGELSAMFFDQGVGIPKTLPRTYGMERIKGFLSDMGLGDDDASRIQAAMALRRSRTGEPHRGKGLMEVREFIDQSGNGRLRIISGRGEYVYSHGGRVTRLLHSAPIGGTLIQWEVYI